jgi:hypothetical protein
VSHLKKHAIIDDGAGTAAVTTERFVQGCCSKRSAYQSAMESV